MRTPSHRLRSHRLLFRWHAEYAEAAKFISYHVMCEFSRKSLTLRPGSALIVFDVI